MSAVPSNRCTLVRQFKSARKFHELATETTDELLGERQHERSQREWLAPAVGANTQFTP